MEDSYMRSFFKSLRKDNLLNICFWTTIILVCLMIGTIAISYTNLPPFLPLYNQMPWGYERLGKAYEIFLLPAGILFITILNTIIGIKLVEKIPLLARFLFISLTMLSLFTYIFILRMIFLVL